MLQKYLLGFALGALVAGGVVWFALSRRPTPQPPPAVPVESAQPQPAPPPAETAAPAPAPEPAQAPAPARTARKARPEPSRWKHAEAAPADSQPAESQPADSQPKEVAQAQPQSQPPAEPQVQLPPPPPGEMNPSLPPPPPPRPRESKILRPDTNVENAANRTPQTVTIPAGTTLAVRLRQVISTDKQSEGDPFTATLDDAVVIDGLVIADRGSLVRGKVSSLTPASRGSSHAALSLELMEINTTDGQKVEVHTDHTHQTASTHPGKDAAKVGAVAALGAIIGAAAGGGKGAAIGAGAGAAGGGGAVLVSKGEEVRLPAETRLTFKLAEPITLTEKIK